MKSIVIAIIYITRTIPIYLLNIIYLRQYFNRSRPMEWSDLHSPKNPPSKSILKIKFSANPVEKRIKSNLGLVKSMSILHPQCPTSPRSWY